MTLFSTRSPRRALLAAGAALVLLGAAACGAPATVQPAPAATAAPTVPAGLQPTAAPAPTVPAARPTSAAPAGDLLRFETLETADHTKLEYAVTTPDGFDASKTYPVLLALPPGGQDKDVVEQLMRRLWSEEARKRGWVVISPAAPGGKLFFDGSERYIPELLDATATTYRPDGGRYFLAGISNGGLSAFRVILNTPERFRSLMVLPGFPYSDADKQKLPALKNIPVAMFVGENDSGWREAAQETLQTLTGLGGQATLKVMPGEGHILSVTGAQLFDILERFRAGT